MCGVLYDLLGTLVSFSFASATPTAARAGNQPTALSDTHRETGVQACLRCVMLDGKT
ncbi:MAG: hypothetical protein EWM73_01565 [Nitrospira sp.]|nr:MAG: hypothetical protein EWM73_01565 [Nitrospira sp.]